MDLIATSPKPRRDLGSVLRDHSRSLCFILALAIALVLSLHAVFARLDPVDDGEGYAMRGFALYGYLHTGQWGSFGELLGRPNQSLCALHYLPFFMLPQSVAGFAGYVAAQNLTSYLLLAYAVFKLAQVLNRPEWAPGIFLLCAVNNVALDNFFAFYLDMEFFALGVAVIAFQIGAWRGRRARDSLLSGLALGLLFWMKPANALVFLATFILSEWVHAADVLLFGPSETSRRRRLLHLFRHWGCQSLAFIPLLGLAFVCGGAQTLLQLINNNEVQGTATPVACTNLLRLLYFPLCLSYYYHVLLLGGLLLAAFLANRWLPVAGNRDSFFPGHLFIPVALSYLVLGEFFSFWMLVKPIRSLLFMLPLLGLAFCWFGEKRRLRVELMFLVAVVYASLAFSQKAFNLLRTKGPWVEDTYQLSVSSWTQMPSPWYWGATLDGMICDRVSQDPPPAGIICINSPELRKLLTWRLNAGYALRGIPPPYEVRYLFNYNGEYFDQALVGARLVVLKTFSPVQWETLIGLETVGILDYGNEEWSAREGLAQISEMPSIRGQPIGYELFFPQPLTKAQVDQANQSGAFSGMATVHGNGVEPLEGVHYSRAEARQLLQAWFNKRSGRAP